MIQISRIALLLGLALFAGAADAREIAPIEGAQFQLGDTSFDAFYVPVLDGYQVVATAQTADAKVIRFVTTLRSGEQATLSVPHGLNEPAEEMVIRRDGSRVELSPVAAAMN